jgi:hypothetical protein
MKRNDLGVRIDEIRELATKYSKPDLARMVEMGMIDPQKAVMAGMMIDRIAKSAMEPPQTTVAQDVLGQQPTTAQMPQQMPQQMPEGIMAAPGAPAPSEGVAALPSGITEMAGGGIVAFDEGGEVPGYADGVYVNSRNDPAMRVDPRVQARRDQDRYFILAQELKDAQSRMERGDPRAAGDVKALQRDMRRMKPAPSADAGIGALLPAAEAATAAPPAKAPVAPVAAPDYFYQDPFGAPSAVEGDISLKEKVESGKPYSPSMRGALFGYEQTPPKPAAAAPKTAVPASKFEVKPAEEQPAPAPKEKEQEVKTPQELTFATQQLELPAKPNFSEQYNQVRQAYREAGVNVDLYSDMRKDLTKKKAGIAEKRNAALGHAMLAFGMGLMGARQGEEFSRMSQEGQKALYQYMTNMERITDNEDRIDTLDRQMQLAEQQFKMTGADSAMRRMDKIEDQRTAILGKNAELAQDANKTRATIAADVYRTDKTFQANMQSAAARIAVALGSNKGGFTDPQLVKLRTDMEIQYGPALRELNKDKGSKEQIDKIVAEEIDKKVLEEVNKARNIRASGQIPVPSSGGGWNVSGGID